MRSLTLAWSVEGKEAPRWAFDYSPRYAQRWKPRPADWSELADSPSFAPVARAVGPDPLSYTNSCSFIHSNKLNI